MVATWSGKESPGSCCWQPPDSGDGGHLYGRPRPMPAEISICSIHFAPQAILQRDGVSRNLEDPADYVSQRSFQA
jgi:hypothetical protein